MLEILSGLIVLATQVVLLIVAVVKLRKKLASSPSDNSSERWYVANNGATDGPYSERELRHLTSQGKLVQTDWVLKMGTEKWRGANTIEGLFNHSLLNWAAVAMIIVAVLAIMLDMLLLQSSGKAPGVTCKLLMSMIHGGFGIFAGVAILQRNRITIAYLGSILVFGAWFWILTTYIWRLLRPREYNDRTHRHSGRSRSRALGIPFTSQKRCCGRVPRRSTSSET